MFMRTGSCTSVVFAVLVAGLSGCTTLPSLEPIDGGEAAPDGSISINAVVKRVKCELYEATKDVQREYWWFRYWGAKVDLDLVVNEQAGISPSVAFVNPLHQFKDTFIGNISQSFSLGLSGGVTGSATRTETVSFSTTFLEVRDQLRPTVAHNKLREFNNCNLPEGSDLNGNLGLKQWVVSALGPVQGGDEALLNWGGAVVVSGAGAKGGGKKKLEAPQSIAYSKCRWTPGTPPLKNASCRPPLDSITHTIEFTIVKNIGVTPSWSLVRFRGQTGNGALAGASRIDTHKLSVTLGPSQEDLGQASANQSLRLLAPTLSNALTQAQTPR
jgi:hypothetical protein